MSGFDEQPAPEEPAPDGEPLAPADMPRGLCLECGYPLRDLVEHRCPICGRPFDPDHPATMDMSRPDGVFAAVRRPARPTPAMVLLAVTLGPVWMAYGTLGILTWAAIPLLLVLLWLARWRVALAFVLLSPAGVFFGWGMFDYARGQAALWYTGLPGYESYNLDPVLRCYHRSSGCMVEGNEWMHHTPYNAAVRLLTAFFGPQRSAYTGPYPTREEAARLLQARGEEVLVKDLLADQVVLSAGKHKLDKEVGLRQLADTEFYLCLSMESPDRSMKTELKRFGPVYAAIVDKRCVVIRIPTGRISRENEATTAPATAPAMGPSTRPFISPDQSERVILIDTVTGRPFAWYVTGETRLMPPVRWRR